MSCMKIPESPAKMMITEKEFPPCNFFFVYPTFIGMNLALANHEVLPQIAPQ